VEGKDAFSAITEEYAAARIADCGEEGISVEDMSFGARN